MALSKKQVKQLRAMANQLNPLLGSSNTRSIVSFLSDASVRRD